MTGPASHMWTSGPRCSYETIDLPEEWWLDDTQIEIETSADDALVIVTGVEVLEPEQVWASSLLMPPEEFERRALESC